MYNKVKMKARTWAKKTMPSDGVEDKFCDLTARDTIPDDFVGGTVERRTRPIGVYRVSIQGTVALTCSDESSSQEGGAEGNRLAASTSRSLVVAPCAAR